MYIKPISVRQSATPDRLMTRSRLPAAKELLLLFPPSYKWKVSYQSLSPSSKLQKCSVIRSDDFQSEWNPHFIQTLHIISSAESWIPSPLPPRISQDYENTNWKHSMNASTGQKSDLHFWNKYTVMQLSTISYSTKLVSINGKQNICITIILLSCIGLSTGA